MYDIPCKFPVLLDFKPNTVVTYNPKDKKEDKENEEQDSTANLLYSSD